MGDGGPIVSRRAAAVTLVAAPLATMTTRLVGTPATAEALEARHGKVRATFVSTADLFNGDVGDLSTLPTWDGGANSVNASWEAAIDKAMAAIARHRPDAVLVAGDMVEGRWNLDTTGRGLFGRVAQDTSPASLAACRRAITTAGGVYYGHYRQMFARRGLTLYPALGDHELLDDRPAPSLNERWSPSGRLLKGEQAGLPDNRYHLVPHCKDTWADHFTTGLDGAPRFAMRPRGSAVERTAYAVDIGPKLRIVTVDVFTRTSQGVRLGVFGPQLRWLRRTIRSAKREGRVVIVQGHVPILRRYRSLASGGLRLPEGHRSPLHRVMVEEGADLYLCGEVHDTTVRQRRRGPVQITHGSIFRYAFNYLHGKVHADGTTVLDYYELPVLARSRERGLWSSDETRHQPTLLRYGDPVRRGRLVVQRRQMLRRTAKLGRYDPATDTWGYEGNLHPLPL